MNRVNNILAYKRRFVQQKISMTLSQNNQVNVNTGK